MMARWNDVAVSEKAALQSFLLDLFTALGVSAPVPPRDDYHFEYRVDVVDREGNLAVNYIDCYRADLFALEGKATHIVGGDDNRMRKAFGQVRTYVAHVSGNPPPYLMVLDLPRHLMLWDRWSGRYGDFAAGKRINLTTLHTRPDDIRLLCDAFEQPHVRDPRARAQAVTKEIAAKLAELAATLEDRVGDQERVARFLMRCVFSCFAEDVGLLPAGLFQRTLEVGERSGGATQVEKALTLLWKTMDEGGMYGAEQLSRFNGHFFKTVEALPLEPKEVQLLIEASRFDWSRVEPSIFGTLLVRALDPVERHRLGAEYTPREYIQRLIEPTVVEPIREKWTAVQGAVLQLEEKGKKPDREKAIKALRDFHDWMRGLHFLDPACGSGNFLYVTMAAVKEIELEVFNEIQRLSGGQGGLVLDEVHPRQFHGIEIKPWAREIAELTLWIGYHQFWRETHGGRTPPTPILEDTGTLECRDAVLAWDEIVHRPEMDRPDPTPRVRHAVTGELVPDPNARLPYYEYVGARAAEWPRADFIVGNPPYIGEKMQRTALGDGYVDALRTAYENSVSKSADFVMYWWVTAAQEVASGRTQRAGLITTNSIKQAKNRVHIRLARDSGTYVIWAISDHPWINEVEGAAVRVAMTVLVSDAPGLATLLTVDDDGRLLRSERAVQLNDDLTTGRDISSVCERSLLANLELCFQGCKIGGKGFRLTRDKALDFLGSDSRHGKFVRPLLTGRDVTMGEEPDWVIDFGLLDLTDARQVPILFDYLRDHVYADRQSSKRKSYREYWWRFMEPRRGFRSAAAGLSSLFATVEVSKFRFFVRVTAEAVPDGTLMVVTSQDSVILGTLSSSFHEAWILASGGRMGVGNDSRYSKILCFDSFPFPTPPNELRTQIAAVAERLDSHRKDALARDERVTMTGMYNVVEKLRSGAALTPKERNLHEIAACGILRDIHDELDALVAQAYGWPWPMEREEILERLVALHDERVAEEARGIVRWLRPEYQIPRFGASVPVANDELALPATSAGSATAASTTASAPWPASAVEQLSAVSSLISQRARTVDETLGAFSGARRDLIQRHLETLALLGEVELDANGRYSSVVRAA